MSRDGREDYKELLDLLDKARVKAQVCGEWEIQGALIKMIESLPPQARRGV